MQLVKDNLVSIVFAAIAIACLWKGLQRPEWLAIAVAFGAIALLLMKKRSV
jgi:hypothetical protein